VVVSRKRPYLVTGHVPLAKQTIITDAEGGSEVWEQGGSIPAPERYSLCRCGQSKKEPFCDGTHTRIGFDGAETASREPFLGQSKVYDGPSLALIDVERLCAFGRFCDPHGKVWNQVGRSDDPDVRATFIRQVQDCPSGRLVAWDKRADAPVESQIPASIGLVEDPSEGCSGPLWLRGGIAMIASDGFEYEVRDRVTLCRCGASKNKPFCDGTHASIKFHAG
jgi:CDGSH-type Zn-finger protein